ncbi:hypothetical protein ACQ86N_40010 [Puia sp. P3]|uniref:hypothetical protein n=1 Tax=Puia sp. P3 TaxID=3423952 RepID=UPI003D6735F3
MVEEGVAAPKMEAVKTEAVKAEAVKAEAVKTEAVKTAAVQTSAAQTATAQAAANAAETRAGNPSGLGSLSKLRQQIARSQGGSEETAIIPLEPELLHRSWQQYADFLRENRNPAVQSLELATPADHRCQYIRGCNRQSPRTEIHRKRKTYAVGPSPESVWE